MSFLLFLLLIAASSALYSYFQKSQNLSLALRNEQKKLQSEGQKSKELIRKAKAEYALLFKQEQDKLRGILEKSQSEFQNERSHLVQQLKRYESLSSREEYQQELDREIQAKKDELHEAANKSSLLQHQITFLEAKLRELEEQELFQSFALYEPKYNFDSSQQYQIRLDQIRDKQKDLIKGKTAAICQSEWRVEGSKQKGQKMTNDFLRLVLRAFNGECDAAISKVKYNNINALEARILKAHETLNKLSQSTHCEITHDYLKLKLEELYLVHEYQEKKQQELEEQRQIKEQMREEERALREIEKAKEEAEKEERRYQQALEKARQEIEQASGAQREKLEEKLQELERQLQEAHANKERAISRAQQTKSGYVYIISNIGSFGEGVYKLGMTRRENPMDRVKELGDASVPFPFDVHATILSNDAPGLENLLHKRFHHRRVNKANERKEFFRVSLEEIATAIQDISESTETIKGEIRLTKVAEAAEYRMSVAMEESHKQSQASTPR